jgi:outer membrane protein OmpA-like peptidoglycan-associated protein
MFEENQRTFAGKAAITALLLTLAGCASAPNPQLMEAHGAYQQVAAKPEVLANAPQELDAAKQLLEKADKAWEEGEKQKAEHLIYMATQQLNIAQTLTQAKQYEQQIDQLGRQRDELVKNMSLQQAQVSQQQAQVAQRQVNELQQQLKDLQTKRTDRGLMVTLSGVLFETGSAAVKPGARHQLDELAQVLRANPNRKALIEGHTDNVGSPERNLDLSLERATTIRNYLIAAGVAPEQVVAKGYGQTRPIAPNSTAEGRQQNRRVEITILDEGQNFPPEAGMISP